MATAAHVQGLPQRFVVRDHRDAPGIAAVVVVVVASRVYLVRSQGVSRALLTSVTLE
jgi:hypothetical protein